MKVLIDVLSEVMSFLDGDVGRVWLPGGRGNKIIIVKIHKRDIAYPDCRVTGWGHDGK
jgi:hypothetical protein